jgi:Tfp pilus assembly protein PilF
MDTETAAGRATLDSRSPTARRIAELYQEALRIDEEDFMVLRQYGIFLTKCGQFEDAKLVFLQSIHFCPNQDVRDGLRCFHCPCFI